MALIWADPCGSFYSTVGLATGLYSQVSAITATASLPTGYVGTTALRNVTNVITQVPQTPGPYYYGTRYVAVQTLVNGQLFIFQDPSGNDQVSFLTNLNGTITAYKGSFESDVILGTSSTSAVIIENVWCYLEFGVTCSATAGTVDIRINGANVLHLTNVNTQGASTTTIGQLNNYGGNVNNYIQDTYICDGTGTVNNTFLGAVHISTYLPISNGTYGAYATNGAALLYECVNAASPADSTIFASDDTVGDQASFNLATTTITGAISGVVVVGRINKSNSGSRTANLFAINGGTTVTGSTISMGTSYAYYVQPLQTDPATGNPFTDAGFNTLQVGIETSS